MRYNRSIIIAKKMVTKKENKYICDECKLEYYEVDWATKCEAWCKKTNSCNIEITNHAIKEDN